MPARPMAGWSQNGEQLRWRGIEYLVNVQTPLVRMILVNIQTQLDQEPQLLCLGSPKQPFLRVKIVARSAGCLQIAVRLKRLLEVPRPGRRPNLLRR